MYRAALGLFRDYLLRMRYKISGNDQANSVVELFNFLIGLPFGVKCRIQRDKIFIYLSSAPSEQFRELRIHFSLADS